MLFYSCNDRASRVRLNLLLQETALHRKAFVIASIQSERGNLTA